MTSNETARSPTHSRESSLNCAVNAMARTVAIAVITAFATFLDLLSRAFVRTCSVETVVGGSDREAGHHCCSEEQVVGYEEVGHRLDDCLNREGGGDTERDRGRISNDETDLVSTW